MLFTVMNVCTLYGTIRVVYFIIFTNMYVQYTQSACAITKETVLDVERTPVHNVTAINLLCVRFRLHV